MALSAPSNQRLSFTYPCEREATISFAPSAEFSDTKVQNVLTRSSAKVLNVVTRSIVVTQSRFTSLVRRLQELVLVASFG